LPHEALGAASGGARLAVRLSPRARREGIEGVVREADGQAVLKVAVAAPPVDGKANAALVALIAAALGVTKSAVSVSAGASGRRKLLFVEGDLAALRDRLDRALETA
jgi:uncharacterized protein YggU (UPF0235/DUF167 family)